MNQQLLAQIQRLIELEREAWWAVAARHAIKNRSYNILPMKDDFNKLHAARFWLTPPQIRDNKLDDQNSIFLQAIARVLGTEDMSDNSWDFQSTILSGYQVVERPSADWQEGSLLGPTLEQRVRVLGREGAVRSKRSYELARIVEVAEGTWSLIVTGSYRSEWGYHPAGKPWVPWNEYLPQAEFEAARQQS